MKTKATIFAAGCALLISAGSLFAQSLQRPNAIWARATAEAITLDGILDEPAWALADSVRLQYELSSGLIPGSGWKDEAGVNFAAPAIDGRLDEAVWQYASGISRLSLRNSSLSRALLATSFLQL